MKDIILVDNAVYSFGFQLDNGIPIFPYIQGKDDKQLLYLKEYLQVINQNNLIKDLKRTFKMKELYESDIDSFLDYYGEDEDNDEVPNDEILDQMLISESFARVKNMSFQGKRGGAQLKFSSEFNTTKIDTIPIRKSDASLQDLSMQKNTSDKNIEPLEAENNSLVDQTPDGSSIYKDLYKFDQKPKHKKRKMRASKLKKVQSQ